MPTREYPQPLAGSRRAYDAACRRIDDFNADRRAQKDSSVSHVVMTYDVVAHLNGGMIKLMPGIRAVSALEALQKALASLALAEAALVRGVALA